MLAKKFWIRHPEDKIATRRSRQAKSERAWNRQGHRGNRTTTTKWSGTKIWPCASYRGRRREGTPGGIPGSGAFRLKGAGGGGNASARNAGESLEPGTAAEPQRSLETTGRKSAVEEDTPQSSSNRRSIKDFAEWWGNILGPSTKMCGNHISATHCLHKMQMGYS